MHTPADLEPNAPPTVGGAVLMKYKVHHIAVIEELHPDGILISETNYTKKAGCPVTTRFVKWDDPAIRGYYLPF